MARGKDVFLRLREIERRMGLSRSTIYKKMGEGTFPRPAAQVGTRGVRWLERDITAWMQSVPARAAREGQPREAKAETEAEIEAEAEAKAEAERPKPKPKPAQACARARKAPPTT